MGIQPFRYIIAEIDLAQIIEIMQILLDGLWQLSPLTDLSIPQDDLSFPAALSSVLPNTLSEEEVAQQEWHLMHDIEVDESLLNYPIADFVISGVDHHAEVRINGVAVFDCDATQSEYRKNIKEYLQLGRNRIEILFLEEEEDLLFDEDLIPETDTAPSQIIESESGVFNRAMGIWSTPYVHFIKHVRLESIEAEQVWHYAGGCEVLVHLNFEVFSPGLLSASVKFNGMTLQLPIDMRAKKATAVFQVEAPIIADIEQPSDESRYLIEVTLDEQKLQMPLLLNRELCCTNA